MFPSIHVQALADLEGGDLLARNIYAMPECVKNTFTIPTSNETATIPKIIIFKACILTQSIILYQES